MLMLFKYLIYVLYMSEDINLMQFLALMFFWALNLVHLQWTLLVYEYPLGSSRDFPLFHVSLSYKNCPSGRCTTVANSVCIKLDVLRRQIFTLSQMWYYFTILLQGVLINYLSILLFVCVCFICVLFIVRFYLCLYVVLFL